MGRHNYSVVTTSDPGATGAEHSYTFEEDCRIAGFSAILVTDANAANRFVKITVEDATGQVYFATGSRDAQVASKTYRYLTVADGGVDTFEDVPGFVGLLWPSDGVFVPKGGKLKTITTAVQATDNWGAMGILIERRA